MKAFKEPSLKPLDNIYLVNIEDLEVHPFNKKIYYDHPDEMLDRDIEENGIRTPLIINKDFKILDGRRRYARAKKFGIKKVPVIIRYYEDEELAIVMLNKYRQKTPRELYLEAKVLEEKFRHLYKVGRPSKREQESKKLFQSLEEFPTLPDKVSHELGISRGKLYQLKAIYENEDKIPNIVTELDRGTLTVHRAYQALQSVLDGADERDVLRTIKKQDMELQGTKKRRARARSMPREYVVRCPACGAPLITNKKVELRVAGEPKSK